jgi:hypothetical protein
MSCKHSIYEPINCNIIGLHLMKVYFQVLAHAALVVGTLDSHVRGRVSFMNFVM